MFKFRPWGFWLVLWQWPLFSKGPRYKLKLLYFKKGGAISMQRHANRTEKWVKLFGSPDYIYLWRMDGDYESSKVKISTLPVTLEKLRWHQYNANKTTLILETQRGICLESDIERAQ